MPNFVSRPLAEARGKATTIDTNAVYMDDEFFFKFYGDNKVSFTKYKGSNFNLENLNPMKGKMGYYYQERNKIVVFLLVKADMAKFDKIVLTIDAAENLRWALYETTMVYKRQKLPALRTYYNPDW